jgi:sodium-dependent phosphate cotransporter
MEKQMENTQTMSPQTSETRDLIIRLVIVAALLFLFLVGVNTLSASFKLLGGGVAKGLLNISSNAFVSLMAGMLATVLFQSSSVTTAIIVGLVSAGTIGIEGAVPMIMGANLGTSVTNTFVSMGYIRSNDNYKKAFAAATVHDFFNILAVAIILPIELATGFLSKLSIGAANFMYGASASVKYKSPLKAAIKPLTKSIQGIGTDVLGFEGTWAGIFMVIAAGIIIVGSLSMIVKTMNVLVEKHKGEIIEKLLAKNAYLTMAFGMLLTIAVQSSSITTSLLVPMAGAGVVSLRTVFPITVGANIGTTTTALLASLTGNVAGLAIALVHFFFNILGTLIWFVPPKMREIPLKCADALSDLMDTSRLIGPGYVAIVFLALPMFMIYLG